MAPQQTNGRQSKVEAIPRLLRARQAAAEIARQLGISVLTVLFMFASTQAAPATISQSDLERVALGQSDKAAVIAALGKPRWAYGYWTPKGETPVQLPLTSQSNWPGSDCEKPYEKLWVLNYKSGNDTRPFLMVLRDGTLDYWIGPTSADERKPETIEARYGKADPWIDTARYRDVHQGIFKVVDVISYEKAGVAFLRKSGSEEFTAKLVAKKVPTGPERQVPCKRSQGGFLVDDDL